MEYLRQIGQNTVLVSAVTGWFVVQVLKFFIHYFLTREWKFERLFGPGGMPSSHASTVCALCISSGKYFSVASFEFAVTFILATIVMHDARGVRLETGKQAKILNDIIAKVFNDHPNFPQSELKELVGHTNFQVLVGGIIGIIVGIII